MWLLKSILEGRGRREWLESMAIIFITRNRWENRRWLIVSSLIDLIIVAILHDKFGGHFDKTHHSNWPI